MLGAPRSRPPEDFVAFIERRAVDLAPADPVADAPDGNGETGGRLTARQRDEVLLALARRWWWLRLQARRLGRPHAADDLLDRMLAEYLAHWDRTAASLTVGPVRTSPTRPTTVLDRPTSMADLAGGVWRQAGRGRRRRAAGAAGVVVLLGLLLFVLPRTSHPDAESIGPPPVPVVTARPP